jgi:hypothetical protein
MKMYIRSREFEYITLFCVIMLDTLVFPNFHSERRGGAMNVDKYLKYDALVSVLIKSE